jgi:CDP-diacylglycerol--serine O-phosphatidyltransferase
MNRSHSKLRKDGNRKLKGRFPARLPARLSHRNLKNFSLGAMVPNMVTIGALCCGMTGVQMAMIGRWGLAVVSVLVAGFLDAMDGRLARLLNSSSRFGAELDSFSDLLSFGAAPALIIYLRSLHQWGELGWGICLFFTVCMALRLARFNTRSIEGTAPAWTQSFFTGVPAPPAAYLALLPLMFQQYRPIVYLEQPVAYGLFLVITGGLMVSRLPTFSLKKTTIPHRLVLPLMLVVVFTLVAVYSQPWLTLSIVGFGYILLLPFSYRAYKRLEHVHSMPSVSNDSETE